MGFSSESTFSKATRFRGTDLQTPRRCKQNNAVIDEIDQLLMSLGPLRPRQTPAPSKYNPNWKCVRPKEVAYSFPTASRNKLQQRKSPSPTTYDVSHSDKVVRKRITGAPWRAPKNPSEGNIPENNQVDSSDTESNASSVEIFVREVLTSVSAKTPSRRRYPNKKSVGYHSVVFSLVERRVRGAPLMEQAMRARESMVAIRQKGRVGSSLRQHRWSALQRSRWLSSQLHSNWLKRRGRGLIVFNRQCQQREKPPKKSSSWTNAQVHKTWSGTSMSWVNQKGRDQIRCPSKGVKKVYAFGDKAITKNRSGADQQHKSQRHTKGDLVPFSKALGREDAWCPFGRKQFSRSAVEENFMELVPSHKCIERRPKVATIHPIREKLSTIHDAPPAQDLNPQLTSVQKTMKCTVSFSKMRGRN